MAVTITQLWAAIRGGDGSEPPPEPVFGILTRQLTVAHRLIDNYVPELDEAIRDEAAIVVVAYLYRTDPAATGRSIRNSLYGSGAAAMLEPFFGLQAISADADETGDSGGGGGTPSGFAHLLDEELGEVPLILPPSGDAVDTGIDVPAGVHWLLADASQQADDDYHGWNWDEVLELPALSGAGPWPDGSWRTVISESLLNRLLRIGHGPATASGHRLYIGQISVTSNPFAFTLRVHTSPAPATVQGTGTGTGGVDNVARAAADRAEAAVEALLRNPTTTVRGAPLGIDDTAIDTGAGAGFFAWSINAVRRLINAVVPGLIDSAVGRHNTDDEAHATEFRDQFNHHNREDPASHADIRAALNAALNNGVINGARLTLTRVDGRTINLALPTSGMAVADGVIQSATIDPDTEIITITTSEGATIQLNLSPALVKFALDTDIDPLVTNITFSANGRDLVMEKQNGDIVTRPLPDEVLMSVSANPAGDDGETLNRLAINGTNWNLPTGGDTAPGTSVVGNPSGTPTASAGKLSIAGTIYRIGARLNPLGQRRSPTQATSIRVITDTGATQDGIIAGPNGAVEANRAGVTSPSRLEGLTVANLDFFVNGLFIRGQAPVVSTLYAVGDCPLVYNYRYVVLVAGSYTRDELITGGNARLLGSLIGDGYDVARTFLAQAITTHGGIVYSRTGTGAGVEPGGELTDTIWHRLVTGRRVEDFPAVAQTQHAMTYYHDRLGAAIRRAGDATRAILVPSSLPSNYGDEARGFVEEFILGRAPRKLGRWVTDQPTGLIDLLERRVGEMYLMRLVLDATSPLNDPIQIRLRIQHGTEAQRTRDLFPEVGNPNAYVSAQYADRHFDNPGSEYFMGFRRQQDGATYHDVHPGDALANLLDSASINTELSDIESDLAHLDYWSPRVMTQAQYDDLNAAEQARGIVIIDPGA